MGEIIGNFEKARKAIRGFYVFGVKKDQRTGHYVGVAAWVARGIPLAGTQVRPMGAKKTTRAASVPGQQSLQIYAPAIEKQEVQSQPKSVPQAAPKPAVLKEEPQPKAPVVRPVPRREFAYADHSDSYEF